MFQFQDQTPTNHTHTHTESNYHHSKKEPKGGEKKLYTTGILSSRTKESRIKKKCAMPSKESRQNKKTRLGQ